MPTTDELFQAIEALRLTVGDLTKRVQALEAFQVKASGGGEPSVTP